ncbi:unnamed protein product, partial [Pocillopora meandrina]
DTFHYNYELWSNKHEFSSDTGLTELDDQETKLPTYWKTKFSKICFVLSKAYPLTLGTETQSVYCHIGRLGHCGDGSWTLIIKINGTTDGHKLLQSIVIPLNYQAIKCNPEEGYNSDACLTGFDDQETKLSTYWHTRFCKICVGIKIGDQIKLTKTADS